MNRQVFFVPVFALGLALVGGCTDNPAWSPARQSKGPTPLAPPDDVYKLVCMYQPPFWKNYNAEKTNAVEGFKCNLYILSRTTGRGVHVPGVLQTRLFVRNRLPDGTVERSEVCAWTQSLDQTPRTTREFELGWAYQPHYYWGDLNLGGREVEIVMWYESSTGNKVYAQTRRDRVPIRG